MPEIALDVLLMQSRMQEIDFAGPCFVGWGKADPDGPAKERQVAGDRGSLDDSVPRDILAEAWRRDVEEAIIAGDLTVANGDHLSEAQSWWKWIRWD